MTTTKLAEALPPLPDVELAEIRNDSINKTRLSETGAHYWGSNWREVRKLYTAEQMQAYALAAVAQAEAKPAPAVQVVVERERVWIKRGVQSFALAYEAETDVEREWYAGQLRSLLAAPVAPDLLHRLTVHGATHHKGDDERITCTPEQAALAILDVTGLDVEWAKPAARTAQEIVDQTEELAGALMLWAHRREAKDGYGSYRDAEDPRGKSCWQMACKAQEILTATDPENAVSELDDEPAAPAAPSDLCERICSAIKATDDKSVDEAGCMLDSNDCIAIVREQFAAAPAAPAPTVKDSLTTAPAAEPAAWINWSALTGEPRLGWQCESEIASEPLYRKAKP